MLLRPRWSLATPIASLTSVPMQFNYDDGFANDDWKFTLNVQPVIAGSIRKTAT